MVSRESASAFRSLSNAFWAGNPPENHGLPGAVKSEFFAKASGEDTLAREVYGLLGIPIDAVEMTDVVTRIEAAAGGKDPFLVSTPNLNFLVASQADAEFRESLLLSDLCTADGMPIVWIASLLGIPLKRRIAGSDVFEALKAASGLRRRLTIFLFGAEDGVAAAAGENINSENGALNCVGSIFPGFQSVESMSTDTIIDAINASRADILAVSLGAQKGQTWLVHNHDRLTVPVRSHLGATINFQAGKVSRAPPLMRLWGMEWVWRIKEEPHLWKRYLYDGWGLWKLLLTRVFPLAVLLGWRRIGSPRGDGNLFISRNDNPENSTLLLSGSASAQNVPKAASCFRAAAATNKNLIIDFAGVRTIDARFIGCLLMLRKLLKRQALSLEFIKVSPQIRAILHLNGFGYLLTQSN